jgi:hypothetical protein
MSESRTERRAVVPSAAGGITRLAYALAEDKGTDVDILLRKSGLSRNQIEDSNARLEVHGQIKFLEFVAEAIGDDLLGFHLSQTFDLRTVGLLYYVFASSDRLDEALRRGARYSSIVNEGIKLTLHEGGESGLLFEIHWCPASFRSTSNRVLDCDTYSSVPTGNRSSRGGRPSELHS